MSRCVHFGPLSTPNQRTARREKRMPPDMASVIIQAELPSSTPTVLPTKTPNPTERPTVSMAESSIRFPRP